MHNINSQLLWNIESIFFIESQLDVILNLTSFNASSRSENSPSLLFSIFNHSDPKKPIGNSSELIVETRQIRRTPSSMLMNSEFLDSLRSMNVMSTLCPLLRRCNWCPSFYLFTLSRLIVWTPIIWIMKLYKMTHGLMRAPRRQQPWLDHHWPCLKFFWFRYLLAYSCLY